VLEQLEHIGPPECRQIFRVLRSQRETLAAALHNALQERGERQRVSAAALLLMLNDKAGREPFLEALAGPEGDACNLAVDHIHYCIFPHDIMFRSKFAIACPVSSDELFSALKRHLHEPWTPFSLHVLKTVENYAQAQPITRSLLAHPDRSIRRDIAESYLCRGRDEGAFAVVEELLREANSCGKLQPMSPTETRVKMRLAGESNCGALSERLQCVGTPG
jgi:hypothetical protein